ncbi:MAG: hypothetical protein ACKVIH_03270 [Burkholderiales bacterium]
MQQPDVTPPAKLSALHVGAFAGREQFRQLVRDALAVAARDGWPEIILSDANFEDWPLSERATAESLQAWAQSGRRITLLARSWDDVSRRHARFVTWRVRWSHITSAWMCPSAQAQEFPSAIWSPHWALERRDMDNFVGMCGSEPSRRLLCRELLAEWIKKSTPGFPASVLGL